MPRRGLRYRHDHLEGDIEPDWEKQKRAAEERLAQVDAMPPDVRDLIHEFNVNPVVDAYSMGLTTVPEIRARLRRQQKAWQDVQINDVARKRNPGRAVCGDSQTSAKDDGPEAGRPLRRPVGP